MKSALILVISSFFLIGVFGESVTVSVMKENSITLHSDLPEIQRADTVEWKLNGVRIAKISIDSNGFISDWVSSDEAFRGRLQLDNQTGDLMITKFKTTDSGQYLLKFRSTRGSSDTTFNVSDADKDPVKMVLGMVGGFVTLKPEKKSDELIQWRFRAKNTSMAELLATVYGDVPDGRFRGRLKLDHHTGSLNITDIRTTDSGDYDYGIRSRGSRYTIYKTFSVIVTEIVTLELVMEGDSVTLHTGSSEISRNYAIQWSGDKNTRITPLPGYIDQNDRNGDLTIRNIRRNQSGDYKVIFTDIQTLFTSIHRKFHITITDVFSNETGGVKTVSVMKGESASLNTSVTEIQKGDLIEWLFGPQNITIAKTDGKSNSISYNDKDVRFKNRLNLDIQTGNLTIKNSNSEHSGRYQLKIINNNTYTIQKSFSVTVNSGLSPGAIAGIVIAVLAAATAVAGVIYYRHKSSKPQRSREVNGQNHTSNKDEETELAKPAEAVE